ncbi:MAG: hypothetical protein MMC23_006829 [Stictis urceolatum]|nr:hypothetical protein [Stictis urceolata]
MLSIRSIARAVPRTLSRPSTQFSRRSLTSLSRPSHFQQSFRLAAIPQRAALSTSQILKQTAAKEGTTDEELSAKFADELKLERENSDSSDLPPHLKEFLDSSPFQVQDTLGDEEVVLTRSFGNEKLRISFTIADLNAIDSDPDAYSQDRAMYDTSDTDLPTETQSGGAQSKNTINQGRTQGGNFNVAPEDEVAPADREELVDEESGAEPSFPARLNITIEKEGVTGAMNFEAVAHDGSITIENVYFYGDGKMAEAKTAELDWARRSVYTGPPYGNLDEDLQVLLEKYLEERGVNTALAVWVPEYVDFKEQREYMKWLNDTKSFIDA